MRIEILVFDGFDALDVVAPWEVFARAATIDSRLEVELVRTGGTNPLTAAQGLQMHVAEELGTVREVIGREIQAFVKAGLIAPRGGGRYALLDEAALRTEAD